MPGLVARMVARLATDAAAERARRLAAYVGLGAGGDGLAALAARLVRPDPEDSPVPFAAYRDAVERPRFAAVFTAHPTFSAPRATAAAIARAASGEPLPEGLAHRPVAPTLEEEFTRPPRRFDRGRDALDCLLGRAAARRARRLGHRWQQLLRGRCCSRPGSATTRMAAPISARWTRCGCASS